MVVFLTALLPAPPPEVFLVVFLVTFPAPPLEVFLVRFFLTGFPAPFPEPEPEPAPEVFPAPPPEAFLVRFFLAGFTDLQAPENNKFDFIRTFLCDKVTAYTVCQAATAALLARATTSKGQHIDISMLHSCLAFMWPDGMMHRTLKDDDKIEMSPGSDYFQTINYTDGGVAVAPLKDSHWEALLPMLGYPELVGKGNFASIPQRMTNMSSISYVMKEPRLDIGVEKAMKVLAAADIPCAPCVKRDDIESIDQIKAIGALETYVTETLGELTVPTPPALFGGESTSQAEPSPLLGEHSRNILI